MVANFAGSADYTSPRSSPVTFTISQATPTVTVSDAGGTYSGSPFPATAPGERRQPAWKRSARRDLLRRQHGHRHAARAMLRARLARTPWWPTSPAARTTRSPAAARSRSRSARATPTVTVSDAGGTYSGSTFPATATVNGTATWKRSARRWPTTPAARPPARRLRRRPVRPARTPSWPTSPAARTTPAPAAASHAFTIARPRRPSRSAMPAARTAGSGFPARPGERPPQPGSGHPDADLLRRQRGHRHAALDGARARPARTPWWPTSPAARTTPPASSQPVTFTIAKATPTVTVSDAGGTYSGSTLPGHGHGQRRQPVWKAVAPTLAYYAGSTATGTSTAAGSQRGWHVHRGGQLRRQRRTTPRPPAAGHVHDPQATPTVTVSDAGGTYSGSAFPGHGQGEWRRSLEGSAPTLTYYAGSAATGTPLTASLRARPARTPWWPTSPAARTTLPSAATRSRSRSPRPRRR